MNAVAVIVTDPNLRPFNFGANVGAVAPPAKEIAGVMVAVEGSLLARVTNNPPGGAGDPKVTRNGTVDPGPTITPVGSWIPSPFVSEKLAGVKTPVPAKTV